MVIEIIRTDVDPQEVVFEQEYDGNGNLLHRARLDAELMTRDQEGEYQARIRPEEEPAP